MRPSRLAVPFCLAGLVLGAWMLLNSMSSSTAQEPAVARGMLPPGWKRLNLDRAQVVQIYTIQSRYRQQLRELEAQIEKLRREERAEMLKVLTQKQKDDLVEILLGAAKEPADDVTAKDGKGGGKDAP